MTAGSGQARFVVRTADSVPEVISFDLQQSGRQTIKLRPAVQVTEQTSKHPPKPSTKGRPNPKSTKGSQGGEWILDK
ncbi:MAG: hypothetical protein M4D80_10020 [Myxococcota bacterium]|nr:hypothetical protein [Myxococcota bacterium]